MPGIVRRRIGAVVVAASVLAAAASGVGAEMQALRPLVRSGEKAPGFSLKDIDGKDVSFRPGSGKPTLVVFWSVFCPTCKELVPEIDGYGTRRGASLRTVGVNLDGKRFSNAVRSFRKETGLRMPVGLDDLRNDFFIASDPYGVEKTPTAVLVDGAGVVRGAWTADRIREFLTNADAIVAGLKKGDSPRK
ncbi:MAG: TlpA family protein disulfide reductase [Deltaproteobacteria bacterium]|nr:TlpA family protein disulfide reductase [Deltaproteobacteria bacterium]